MDRSESKNRLEEVATLINSGQMEEATHLLDSVNWRKVHNVSSLLNASELYEQVNRLEDARDLLEIAHERSPIGRMIIFRLAIVSVKLGALDEAREYYDEFLEVAPHDSLKFIIQYELSKARQEDIQTQIAILEELKMNDFREEWAFELACRYREAGMIDKCIALCDEIVLWFGDGAYVEQALEMKILYQPLNKEQEGTYRKIRNRRDGVTEIRPHDSFDGSGEILSHTIEIPEIDLTAGERFNTHNLQAEIQKNIEEIMQASEMGEVSENMDAIKDLVVDIPYLQVQEEKDREAIRKGDTQKIGEMMRDRYKQYLSEEFDGQMSLFMPEEKPTEEQIDGQMTIEEVLAQWEKTKRAAEATLSDAKEMELLQYKQRAIEEASLLLARLQAVSPQLEAGVSSSELLREEYLAKPEEEAETLSSPKETEPDVAVIPVPIGSVSEAAMSKEEETEPDHQEEVLEETGEDAEKETEETLAEPKADIETKDEEALADTEEEVEENHKEDEAASEESEEENKIEETENDLKGTDTKEPEPEIAKEEPEKEEPKKTFTIPRIAPEGDEIEAGWEIPVIFTQTPPVVEESAPSVIIPDHIEEEPTAEALAPVEEEMQEPSTEMVSEEIQEPSAEMVSEEIQEPSAEMVSEEIQEPSTEMALEEMQEPIAPAVLEDVQEPMTEAPTDEISIQEQMDQMIAESREQAIQDLSEMQSVEAAKEQVMEQEDIRTELTAEEKEIFSYFTKINGMEAALCQLLTGSYARLSQEGSLPSGHIVIQGRRGSGKSMLATHILRVLQMKTGRPNGNIGKITGEKLNEKDLKKLFDRIRGGALIIEGAGELERETVVTMSIMMESDSSGILVILEDSRAHLEKLLTSDGRFSKKFTERITVPIMTIDELVEFGKSYAKEQGFEIDEMGILALYDKINMTQSLEHPTCVADVKEIMDYAISNFKPGHKGLKGIFGGRKQSGGLQVLQERDFQGE